MAAKDPEGGGAEEHEVGGHGGVMGAKDPRGAQDA